MDSPSLKVQCQAALALRNLASDGELPQRIRGWKFRHSVPLLTGLPVIVRPPARAERYQVEIVKHNGLPALLRLLKSSFLPLVLSAAACVRNVSIHPQNESPIIEAGFLGPLVDLVRGSRDS